MTPQQPFTPPGHSPSEATHIECGVYLIMMIQMWLAHQPLSAITPLSVQQYRRHLAYFLVLPSYNVHLTQWITTSTSGSINSLQDPPTLVHADPTSLALCQLIPTTDPSTPILFDRTHLSTNVTKRLRPRKLTAPICPPSSSPSRIRHHFQINDPASMHTYASESTLPNAGWGLFADRLVGPDSPLDYGHVIGEYFGRILTEEDIKAYILDTNPSVNTGFMISFQGLAIDAWDHTNGTYTCMTALTND